MRVLHFLYDDVENPWVGGGGAVRVRELYRRLAPGVVATVCTGAFPGGGARTWEGITFLRLGVGSGYVASRLSYAAQANRLIRRERADAVIVDFSSWSPILAPRSRRVGVVVHQLGSEDPRFGAVPGELLGRAERALLSRAHAFCASSETTKRTLRSLGLDDRPVTVAPGGVSPEDLAVERSEGDAIVYLGRYDIAQKGLDVLAAAFARVAREDAEVRLILAGRGRDEVRVRALFGGFGARVELRGGYSADERRRLQASALVQVLPSRFESFGIAAVEALATGVPLVASDLPALRDATSGAAEFSPAGDADALAARLLRLLRSPAERARLSTSGRVQAARFTWDESAKAYLRFLEGLAGD